MRTILDGHPVFNALTPSQKRQLFQMVAPVSLLKHRNTVLIRENEKPDACYYIHRGLVKVMRTGREVSELTHGRLFGIHPVLKHAAVSEYTYSARPDTVLFRFASPAITAFAENNPGVFLKLCSEPF
jgi:signal-transduction protein with cAMP-binding, CBS, and nucleotidyltransferase domain